MTITYCNNLDELLLKLIRIDKDDIDFFYISIGSKLNEPVVHLRNEKKISNACYQMIPQCLRNPHTEKMKIVIILDSFSLDWEQVIRSIIKSAFSNSVFGLEMASLIEIISPLKKSLLKPCSIKIFNCFCVVLPFGMTNGHEISALGS